MVSGWPVLFSNFTVAISSRLPDCSMARKSLSRAVNFGTSRQWSCPSQPAADAGDSATSAMSVDSNMQAVDCRMYMAVLPDLAEGRIGGLFRNGFHATQQLVALLRADLVLQDIRHDGSTAGRGLDVGDLQQQVQHDIPTMAEAVLYRLCLRRRHCPYLRIAAVAETQRDFLLQRLERNGGAGRECAQREFPVAGIVLTEAVIEREADIADAAHRCESCCQLGTHLLAARCLFRSGRSGDPAVACHPLVERRADAGQLVV